MSVGNIFSFLFVWGYYSIIIFAGLYIITGVILSIFFPTTSVGHKYNRHIIPGMEEEHSRQMEIIAKIAKIEAILCVIGVLIYLIINYNQFFQYIVTFTIVLTVPVN